MLSTWTVFAVIKMIQTSRNELTIWVKAGRPIRPAEIIRQLFNEQCRQCAYFQGGSAQGSCAVCNCGLKVQGVEGNLLAMATTRCPLPEPKWVEYEGVTEFYTPAKLLRKANADCCGS